jgi:hypothetical protein
VPTAGLWFSLKVIVRDQWGEVFDAAGIPIIASLDPRNQQGAIMWDQRSNETDGSGVSFLHRLVVSQAGTVELRIHSYRYLSPTSMQGIGAGAGVGVGVGAREENADLKRVTVLLAAFQMSVRRDPNKQDSAPCMFAFREVYSDPTTTEDSWNALSPNTRGKLPTHLVLRALACLPIFDQWYVSLLPGPNGDLFLEYRSGIAAVWTGRDFPAIEQRAEERLGLSRESWEQLQELSLQNAAAAASTEGGTEPTTAHAIKGKGKSGGAGQGQGKGLAARVSRDIRRAYYKKSLQWHPDRWAGMAIYSDPVIGAFQLVTEAYSQLIKMAGG